MPYVITPEEVSEALLGRGPTGAERAAHDGNLPALVRALAAGPGEGSGSAVLAGTPAAGAVHPVGSESPDGVARVGTDGWLCMVGDSNDSVAQATGTYPLEPGWAAAWEALVAGHHALATRRGARVAHILIPDRMPVIRSRCCGLPPQQGPRPLELLRARLGSALAYPLGELTAQWRAGDEAFFRTDSHIAGAAIWVCYRAILAQLGLAHHAALEDRRWRPVLFWGDLGAAFAPRVVELIHFPADPLDYGLVEDDSERVFQSGGHLGARRVTRCDTAPHDATAVVFGDSFSWVHPPRPGGLGELLAATFRETHFVWTLCRADPRYLERVGADVVIFEMGERGAVAVPPSEIDVTRLAEETVNRSG